MVTFLPAVRIGLLTYLVSWTSDQVSPTFRVYIDGVLVSIQTETSFMLTINANEVFVLEVLDVADAVPQPAFPSYLTLGWNDDPDADKYRIDKDISGTWTEQATLKADHADPYPTYATAVIPDQTTTSWRVVPIDAAGNAGTAVQFSALMVRYPDVPDVAMSYSGVTGRVTVAAA